MSIWRSTFKDYGSVWWTQEVLLLVPDTFLGTSIELHNSGLATFSLVSLTFLTMTWQKSWRKSPRSIHEKWMHIINNLLSRRKKECWLPNVQGEHSACWTLSDMPDQDKGSEFCCLGDSIWRPTWTASVDFFTCSISWCQPWKCGSLGSLFC